MLGCRSQPWLPMACGRRGFFARCGGITTGACGAAGEGSWGLHSGKMCTGGGGAGEVHATHGGHDLECALRCPAALYRLGEGTPALWVRASTMSAQQLNSKFGGAAAHPLRMGSSRAENGKSVTSTSSPPPRPCRAARGTGAGPSHGWPGGPLEPPPALHGLRSQAAARCALFGEEPRPWAPPWTPARRRARRCPVAAAGGQNPISQGGF